MKNLKSWFVRITLVFAFCLLVPYKAVADTYRLVTLISDEDYFFDGMDDSGDVTISHPGFLGANPGGSIYYNFLNGVAVGSFSTIAPTFVPDNGSPCTPALPAGESVVTGVCNNGREAFLGFVTPGQVFGALYEGPPFTLISSLGRGSLIYMDANGDIVFNEPVDENWLEAIDLTTSTPEPNTLLLFGTGVVAIIQSIRRARQDHRTI